MNMSYMTMKIGFRNFKTNIVNKGCVIINNIVNNIITLSKNNCEYIDTIIFNENDFPAFDTN